MWLSSVLLVHSFIVHFLGVHAAPLLESDPDTYQWQTQLLRKPDWQRYIRSPKTNIIHPVGILSDLTEGNVTNPTGLVTGDGPTILTRTAPSNLTRTLRAGSNATPVIVVDFSQNVAGYLSIKFAGASNSTPGLPGIRLAFSETVQYGYLTNFSDFSRSDNVSHSNQMRTFK